MRTAYSGSSMSLWRTVFGSEVAGLTYRCLVTCCRSRCKSMRAFSVVSGTFSSSDWRESRCGRLFNLPGQCSIVKLNSWRSKFHLRHLSFVFLNLCSQIKAFELIFAVKFVPYRYGRYLWTAQKSNKEFGAGVVEIWRLPSGAVWYKTAAIPIPLASISMVYGSWAVVRILRV